MTDQALPGDRVRTRSALARPSHRCSHAARLGPYKGRVDGPPASQAVGGSVVLVVGGVGGVVETGGDAVVPPNIPHSVRVTGAVEVVVTDFPLREHLRGAS